MNVSLSSALKSTDRFFYFLPPLWRNCTWTSRAKHCLSSVTGVAKLIWQCDSYTFPGYNNIASCWLCVSSKSFSCIFLPSQGPTSRFVWQFGNHLVPNFLAWVALSYTVALQTQANSYFLSLNFDLHGNSASFCCFLQALWCSLDSVLRQVVGRNIIG